MDNQLLPKFTIPEVMDPVEAKAIAGSLSNTNKMPGYSYSIPAEQCKVGGKLRNVKGSACENCYCFERGNYNRPNVINALQHRYASIFDDRWVDAMTSLILNEVKFAVPYFRWHDAGDLQGLWHLEKIMDIAERLPMIQFWLPTQERKVVKEAQRKYTMPSNLTIRISAAMKDGKVSGFENTSVVSSKRHEAQWGELVGTNSPMQYHCPAPLQDHKCQECRACWDQEVRQVAYLEF